MADNIFDTGGSFPRGTRSDNPIRIGSVDRDRVMSTISKISDEDLQALYADMNSVQERAQERNTSQTNIINERYQVQLRNLDQKYNLSDPDSLSNIFDFGEASRDPSGNLTREYFTLMQFHVGAKRRARLVEKTISNYIENIEEKSKSGDVVYMTNSTPCKKFDMSKSPYERFKKIWEESKGNLALIIGSNGELKVDLSFLPEGTRERASEFLRGSIRPPSTWESGIFDREQLKDGVILPVDLGTTNGSYSQNIEYQNAKTFTERRQIANASISPITFPSGVQDFLENGLDSDGNPNGNKLDNEYVSLMIQYLFDVNMEDVKNYIEEYQKYKNLTPEEQKKMGGFIPNQTLKNQVVASYISALALLESAKGPLDFVGKFDTIHTVAETQGYIELIANSFKILYYINKGKYKEATIQSGITFLSLFSEFGWPKFAEKVITNAFPGFFTGAGAKFAGLGGYVGLTISAGQFYHEFVTKPKYAAREFAIKNELLDLERKMIENECCTKIHPDLYRKTGGQFSVLMTDDDAIPVGKEYTRTIQGPESNLNAISSGSTQPIQPGPCNSNGEMPVGIQKRYIKFKSAFDIDNMDAPSSIPSQVPYIIDPREDKDPCGRKNERESQRKSQQGEGDIGLIDYTPDTTNSVPPFWSPIQENNLQNAIVEYNTDYASDVYKHKIDSSKCKTNEIPTTSPYGGGGPPDRDGFYAVGESGMTSGFHRIGSTIIARKIFETATDQATMDSSAAGRDTRRTFWNGEWEVTTREYGFNVGGGGAGTGTKLRGITSFFYDPLNPPKPIRQV